MLRLSHLAFWTNFISQLFLLHADENASFREPQLLQDTLAVSAHPVEVRDYRKNIHAAQAEIERLEEEEQQPGRVSVEIDAAAETDWLRQREAHDSDAAKPSRAAQRRTGGPRAGQGKRAKAARGSGKTVPTTEHRSVNASRAEGARQVVVQATGVEQAAGGRLFSDTPNAVTASQESIFEDCLRQGLCARPMMTSPRASFLAATLALVVLVSFKIGLSLGTTGMRIYQGAIDGFDKIPKRTPRWRQTPEEILAEVYAQSDSRLRGRGDLD